MQIDESNKFLDAVKAGDLAVVSSLLAADPQLLNVRDESGVSVLMLAAYYGKEEITAYFLSRKGELDIFEAAALADVERLGQLIERDPSVMCGFSEDGFTPLGLAAYFGRIANLTLLVENGADVNEVSRNQMHVCPLHSAVAYRQADISLIIAKRLLESGAQVNAVQYGGWTPLHQAAAHGNLEMVDLLLDYGADPAIKSDNGRTALMMAEDSQHFPVIRRLIGNKDGSI